MPRGGPLRAAVLATLAVPLLAGCALFGFPPYWYGGPSTWEPRASGDFGEFPEPSIASTYTSGSATLTFDDGTVVELNQVAPSSHFDVASGSSIRWLGADGYHVMLFGAGADMGWGSFEYLQIDRVFDSKHWTISFEGGCAVDVDEADETNVRGTATCRGVQWSDALDMSWSGEPGTIDEPEFDVDITFEATSDGASSSG